MSLKNYGLLASFLLALSSPASALVVITSDTSGAGSTTAPFEQSVTTPAGGSWTDIGFSFVDTGSNPIAEGSLYALTQAYAGLPDSLSTATAGDLDGTSTITGGVGQFNALTLNASTQNVAPEPGTLGLMAGAMVVGALFLSRRKG